MLSKEESLKKAKELSYGWHVGDNEFVPLKDVNKLIRETYSSFNKEIEYFKQLEKNYDDLYEEVHNPQPYKWEDLKVGMWVYDTKREYEDYSFIKITKILSKEDCEHLYHDKNKKVFFDNIVCHAREFEDNRFFPVWMANMRCE